MAAPAVLAADPAALARPTAVAALALTRVSGISPATLDALRLGETRAALRAAVAAEAGLAACRAPLEALLYEAIPALDGDRVLRRAALQLKRDVHHERPTGLAPALLDELGRRLPRDGAERLAAWRGATEVLLAARARAEATLPGELAGAAEALAAALARPEMRAALALGSQEFLEALTRRDSAKAGPGTRLARTGLAYVSRAAVKTSPFSSFTTVGVTSLVGEEVVRTLPLGGRRDARPARALAVSLLLACARDEQLAPALRYEANVTARVVRGRTTLLAPGYACVDGFYWRREDPVDATVVADDLRTVAALGVATHEEVLSALGGEDPHRAFTRLLEQGVIRPLAPWSESEADPARRLADVLLAHGGTRALALAERLLGFAGAAAALPAAAPAERVSLLARVRRCAHDGLALLSEIPPPWLGEAAVVYEDVASPLDPGPLPPPVRTDLERAGALMRPQIVRSRLYDELVDHFAARHGAGGECRDVLGFLLDFLAHPGVGAAFTRMVAADAGAREDPAPPAALAPVGPGSAPPTAGLAYQLAARDDAALARGEHLLVVNQHNPGLGAMTARFSGLLDDAGLGAGLRAWIEGRFPDADPHVLAYGADWNELQAQGAGGLPALHWPGELRTGRSAPGLELDELTLRHDDARGTLDLVGPTGRPVAPVYLGSVPQYLVLGPVRLLLVLADPWVNASSMGKIDNPRLPLEPVPREVERHPRWADGRLVLRRELWRVPLAQWPTPETGERDLAYLHRVERWRERHGLPLEAFVTLVRPNSALDAGKRKPMWLAFDSLHALRRVASALAEDVVCVRVVEALPGREQHWARDEEGAPRATELISLLAWERAR